MDQVSGHSGPWTTYRILRHQGLVPEGPINVNPGLKFCSVFVFCIPIHFVVSLLYLIVMLNSIL